jgi:hypothetical protein
MGKMTKAQAGRKGGLATKSRHGSGYFAKIGRKGGLVGGKVTKARHGTSHFKRIGSKGGRS